VSSDRIRKLLAAFLKVRNIAVDADSLRMWIDAFSDLPAEAIELAIRRFNRESTDYPTPASVRRYAGAAALTDEQRAVAAWRVVRAAVLRYGAYYAIDFDDPLIHAAIRGLGGWVQLCHTPATEMQWRQKDFERQYLNVCRAGTGDFRPLGGLLENQTPQRIETGLTHHCTVAALIGQAQSGVKLPNLRLERAVS
jgi:hypothetical protein